MQNLLALTNLSLYLDILKIVPEPTMTNRAPLSLMNRLKKPIELSVSVSNLLALTNLSLYLDILKIVPEPTMTNRAPLSLMNRLKKPIELSVSVSVCPSVRKL
ncbi:hypothetical protein DPMN_010666 [Dreissena polymorpha]|uniref:Uncharacterized protein n=1 Tax=Dreissena polymorpha TaxID=45954 RepID=A0A9D4N3K5_DREPO|nr:hypothetical protein DPMN_010666 [Dreissena polymorpha]